MLWIRLTTIFTVFTMALAGPQLARLTHNQLFPPLDRHHRAKDRSVGPSARAAPALLPLARRATTPLRRAAPGTLAKRGTVVEEATRMVNDFTRYMNTPDGVRRVGLSGFVGGSLGGAFVTGLGWPLWAGAIMGTGIVIFTHTLLVVLEEGGASPLPGFSFKRQQRYVVAKAREFARSKGLELRVLPAKEGRPLLAMARQQLGTLGPNVA